jgi:hypothetical protein
MSSPFGATGPTKFVRINRSTAATFDEVAAVSGLKIRVLAVELTAAGTVGITFQSKTTPTIVSGKHSMTATGSRLSMPFSPAGHFETVAGEALQMILDAAVLVAGHIVYQETP